MEIPLVGIDCATDDKKVGIARGSSADGAVRLLEVALCGNDRPPAGAVANWLKGITGPALVALDAPLGWPAPLSRALAEHRAGEPVQVAPNDMFRRETDRFIARNLRKTPLDVGADRIARTAHAALRLLDELRKRLESPVPLAWDPNHLQGVAAIEVYPAATLLAHRMRSSSYKGPENIDVRQEMLAALESSISIDAQHRPLLETSADALDAVVCLVAANDFLGGRAAAPPDKALAEREGWIWSAQRSNAVT